MFGEWQILSLCSEGQAPSSEARGGHHHSGDVSTTLELGYLDSGLLQPDQVHLDPQVLHEELPGHSPHGVEGVVRVGVGGTGKEEVAVGISVHLVSLPDFLTLHQQPLYALALHTVSQIRRNLLLELLTFPMIR